MKYLNYFIKLILFWLLYFLFSRIIFIFYFWPEISLSPFIDIISIFFYSIPLDISFISYILSIIFILLWISLWFSKKIILDRCIYYLNMTILLISGFVIGSEVSLYSEWNTKLNFKALSHLANISEVIGTASFFHIYTVFIFFLFSLFFMRIYRIYIHIKLSEYTNINVIRRVIVLPILITFLLLGIRGGVQPIPINLSDVYFSKNIIINDITVNPNWNLVQSLLKSKTNLLGNPYKKYSDVDAENFYNTLRLNNIDANEYILNTLQPNIILIVLESWSADNIENLGGLKGITPYFKSLEKKGLLFNNFYSNGWTSDQGISSIFSSFPVFPYVAVINQSDKSRRLPCLNKSLSDYHSSFFFGGQLTYGNIKGYLMLQQFDVVKDENNYNHLPSGRLGVHDEYMFNEFRKEINSLPQPFFSTLFTISSHSPFDFPGEHKLSFNSREDKYVNSVAYTDKCLGSFFNSIKDDSWYDSTLFIIVSDHSHASPLKRRLAQKERYKIPMLWLGNVLKDEYVGKEYGQLGSHIDIAPTILNQLGLDNKRYTFGRDLFNPTFTSVVPYAFHRGYGLIKDSSNYAYSENYNKILEIQAQDSIEIKRIKIDTELYFQYAFKQYIDL